LNMGDLTQFAENSTIAMHSQDGYAAGTLESLSIDETGLITGRFSNDRQLKLAQVALTWFSNPEGLERAGGTNFAQTANSGQPTTGVPGSKGLGKVVTGALEMSNVDLAQEFTNMIVTQRGFQASSRVITTSDEMLQELVNLRR